MLKRTDDTGPLRGFRKSRSGNGAAARAAGPDAKIDTKIDLGELSTALGYALRRAQLAAFKNFKDTFKGIEITPAQYSVLIVIDRNPGLKQNQISDALGIKRANFVLLLDSLETRGLAQRARAQDRRSYALQLTPRGRRLLKKLRGLSADLERRFTAPIGPDGHATLLKLLTALAVPLEDK